MINNELFEKIKFMVVECLDVEPEIVTIDAHFSNDLGGDSLDGYEMIYKIEEELGITIPDEKALSFKTIQDAIDFIEEVSK